MVRIIILSLLVLFPTVKHVVYAKDNQMKCLVEAVYREARGATLADKRGVARTILNRSRHPKDFASTPCGVIRQKTGHVRQFSWSKHLFIKHTEKEADLEARKIVLSVLRTPPRGCEKNILFFAKKGHSVGVNTHVCFRGAMSFRVPVKRSAYVHTKHRSSHRSHVIT